MVMSGARLTFRRSSQRGGVPAIAWLHLFGMIPRGAKSSKKIGDLLERRVSAQTAPRGLHPEA
jgi:hypothetical protein